MAKERQPQNNGYVPEKSERGYQPRPTTTPTGDPAPKSGYIPSGSGDNPSNPATPPGDE